MPSAITASQPLDNRGRLGGDAVDDPVDTLYFFRDTRGNQLQDLRQEHIPACEEQQAKWGIIFACNDEERTHQSAVMKSSVCTARSAITLIWDGRTRMRGAPAETGRRNPTCSYVRLSPITSTETGLRRFGSTLRQEGYALEGQLHEQRRLGYSEWI